MGSHNSDLPAGQHLPELHHPALWRAAAGGMSEIVGGRGGWGPGAGPIAGLQKSRVAFLRIPLAVPAQPTPVSPTARLTKWAPARRAPWDGVSQQSRQSQIPSVAPSQIPY